MQTSRVKGLNFVIARTRARARTGNVSTTRAKSKTTSRTGTRTRSRIGTRTATMNVILQELKNILYNYYNK